MGLALPNNCARDQHAVEEDAMRGFKNMTIKFIFLILYFNELQEI